MHLRTHVIMEMLIMEMQEIPFWHFGDTNASLWGGSIPKSTRKEFENSRKQFLTKFLHVKKPKAIHPPH